ncbi:MAG: hypothetical protein KTR24_15425 [Saprospiraceae bacterium]|nr:hypothetical protein [Saprospiraceae bacterium]
MNQFTFPSRARVFLMVCMAIGLVCLGITYVTDDALHTRFWSNLLHNSVFFTGIAFLALFFLCANVIAFSGWYTVFKRLWEAYAQFLIVGLVLLLVIVAGLWMHAHHLYHWADADAVAADEILQHKSAFLNPLNYTLFTVIIVGLWIFFARKIRSISLEEENVDKFDFSVHKRKLRIWAAAFLPIAGFSSAAMVWLWVMSVDAHWYSTLFAWYATISWFVTMLCITVLTLIYLKGKGYFTEVTSDHFHDLGKYIFGFSVFWTYLWFSQYMLIWYGNVGEETIYFKQRLQDYPVLFYANLAINFVLPFFVLMRNDTKRKAGSLTVITIVLILGHWLDYFLMLKPGILHTAHEVLGHDAAHHAADHAHGAAEHAHHASHMVAGFTLPGFLEIGTFIGFAGLFAFFFLRQLTKAPLVSYRDPYIDESLHHHVV